MRQERGTDDCVPQMGYHYVNFPRLDDRLQPSRPEALIYVDGPHGNRALAVGNCGGRSGPKLRSR